MFNIIVRRKTKARNDIPMNAMKPCSFAIVVEAPLNDSYHLGKLVYRTIDANGNCYDFIQSKMNCDVEFAKRYRVEPVDVEIIVSEEQ